MANKDTWTLIYLVNYLFELHDVFVGSFIAHKLVRFSKRILMNILETRRDSLNQEQSSEINSLLNIEAMKGSRSLLSFESDTKSLKEKLESEDLQSKIEGLNELAAVFGKCYDLADQLQLFTKCVPLLRALFSKINNKTVINDSNFPAFIKKLKSFTTSLVFDTQLFV